MSPAVKVDARPVLEQILAEKVVLFAQPDEVRQLVCFAVCYDLQLYSIYLCFYDNHNYNGMLLLLFRT